MANTQLQTVCDNFIFLKNYFAKTLHITAKSYNFAPVNHTRR